MTNKSLLMGAGAATIVWALSSSIAWAQTDTRATAVEEIVVTAERREASLQKVPVAVTALTASRVEAAGAFTATELFKLTPGLTQSTSFGLPLPVLRGVGIQTGTAGNESTVPIYVDGVYLATSPSSSFELNNIERIEVLKGPQGTLFGRNSSGGLIQIITKKPSHSPLLQAQVGYGNYDTVSGKIYATTGISDALAVSLAATGSKQGNGWGRQLSTGEDINKAKGYGVQAKALWTPTDDISIILSVDYSALTSDIGSVKSVYPGAIAINGFPHTGGFYDSPTTTSNKPLPYYRQGGASVTATYAINDNVSIRSLTAYREFRDRNRSDTAVVPGGLNTFNALSLTNTWQQELLVQGDYERFNWTVGATYFYINPSYSPQIVGGNASQLNHFNRWGGQRTNSTAGFVQGSYAITDRTNLTLGGRYTYDARQLKGSNLARADFPGTPNTALPINCPVPGAVRNPTTGVVPSFVTTACQQSRDWHNFTYRVALDHQLTDDMMVYASVSTGFKSGWYNTADVSALPVNPETLTAYAAGFKSELFEHRLRFNAEAFYYRYKDIQLNASGVPQSQGVVVNVIINAAKAEMYGVDLDASWVPDVPVGRLQFDGALSILHAEYIDFPGAILNRPRTVAPFGNETFRANGAGQKMYRAPSYTVSLAGNYDLPLASGDHLTFNANYYRSGKMYWSPVNRLFQKPYDLVDGMVKYSSESDRWWVSAWVKNLTDKKYFADVQENNAFGDSYAPGAPRTFGVTIGTKIGG